MDNRFSRLNFSVHDASGFQSNLQQQYMVFNPENPFDVSVFRNKWMKNDKADAFRINRAFRDLKVPQESIVFIFYSGHGSKTEAIIPYDWDGTPEKSMSKSQLIDLVKAIKAKYIILIIDACNSDINEAIPGLYNPFQELNNIVAISSSFETQTSIETGTGQNGLFTEQMLTAFFTLNKDITRKIDLLNKRDNCISLYEAFLYIKEKLQNNLVHYQIPAIYNEDLAKRIILREVKE